MKPVNYVPTRSSANPATHLLKYAFVLLTVGLFLLTGCKKEVDIDPACQNTLLPPLTLQLLVENTVKHNEVSAERPLNIRIATYSTDALVVQNTLQRKLGHSVASTRMGLLNITEKYRLLNQPSIVIQETTDQFVVTLPLIARHNQSVTVTPLHGIS